MVKIIIKIFIVYLALIYQGNLYAADSTSIKTNNSTNILITVVNDFKSTGADINILSYKISHLDYNSIIYATGISAGTALSFLLDDEIRKIEKKYNNKHNDKIYNITNKFGEGINAVIFSSSMYLGGLFWGSNSVRTTGRLLLESIVLSALTTQVIKYVTGRSRPFVGKGNADFNFFSLEDKYNSFPSGHTAVAFSMASVLSRQIDTWWAYAGFYSLALSTGGARMYYDKHWLSDVFLGAAIGIISGNVICSSNSLAEYQHKNKDQTYLIYPTYNGIGFAVNF